MKLKPMFYKCAPLLQTTTICARQCPSSGLLVWFAVFTVVLGTGLGFLSTGMYTVSSVQAVTEWSSVALGL